MRLILKHILLGLITCCGLYLLDVPKDVSIVWGSIGLGFVWYAGIRLWQL